MRDYTVSFLLCTFFLLHNNVVLAQNYHEFDEKHVIVDKPTRYEFDEKHIVVDKPEKRDHDGSQDNGPDFFDKKQQKGKPKRTKEEIEQKKKLDELDKKHKEKLRKIEQQRLKEELELAAKQEVVVRSLGKFLRIGSRAVSSISTAVSYFWPETIGNSELTLKELEKGSYDYLVNSLSEKDLSTLENALSNKDIEGFCSALDGFNKDYSSKQFSLYESAKYYEKKFESVSKIDLAKFQVIEIFISDQEKKILNELLQDENVFQLNQKVNEYYEKYYRRTNSIKSESYIPQNIPPNPNSLPPGVKKQ